MACEGISGDVPSPLLRVPVVVQARAVGGAEILLRGVVGSETLGVCALGRRCSKGPAPGEVHSYDVSGARAPGGRGPGRGGAIGYSQHSRHCRELSPYLHRACDLALSM